MNLRVVTINVWHGGRVMEPLLAFLKDVDPDILFIQEARSSKHQELELRLRMMEYFQAELGYQHSDFVPHYRDYDESDGLDYAGNAIFSKLPIKSRKIVYYDTPYSETYRDVPGNYHNCPGTIDYYELETVDSTINAFNIHGPLDFDGDHFGEGRRKMSDAIISMTSDLEKVILAGDTNSKPTNEAFTRITHLNNVFGDSLTSTFNMRHKDNPGYATAVVDMMLVSPDIKILTRECPDIDVSDHRPLVVQLEV